MNFVFEIFNLKLKTFYYFLGVSVEWVCYSEDKNTKNIKFVRTDVRSARIEKLTSLFLFSYYCLQYKL